MIQKVLLKTQIIWMIFKKILKNTNQIKRLIVFDDMVTHMLSNKRVNPIVTELFIRVRKLNISLVFIRQYYFAVPKNITLNSTHYFVMKIPSRRELQEFHLIIYQILTFMILWIFIKMRCKTIFCFVGWYYSCIREFLTFEKESFRLNIKTNHENWW